MKFRMKTAAGPVLVALATGFALGMIIRGVLWVVEALTNLIWVNAANAINLPFAPLIICTVGGIVIGAYTTFFGGAPAELNVVIARLKRTGRFEVKSMPKSLGGFVLPLIFGGSVGPEAGLTGLIATGCSWISRSLKLAGEAVVNAAEIGTSAAISAIFGAPLAGFALLGENDEDSGFAFRKSAKVVLYLASSIGAFGGVYCFGSIFGRLEGLPHFEAFNAQAFDLVAVIPCLIAAYVLALVWFAAERGFGAASCALGERPFVKPVIAGIALGALALAAPHVLFSGEHQIFELMDQWDTFTAVGLAVIAVTKVLATSICLNFGWKGGHFFPNIFAGVACGYALGSVTGADPLLCVALTTSTFLAATLRKPVLVVCLLLICFPAHGILWMTLGAVIGSVLPIPKTLQGSEDQPL